MEASGAASDFARRWVSGLLIKVWPDESLAVRSVAVPISSTSPRASSVRSAMSLSKTANFTLEEPAFRVRTVWLMRRRRAPPFGRHAP
jgi:hypothetical protein